MLNETGSVANTPLKNEDGADISEQSNLSNISYKNKLSMNTSVVLKSFLLINNAALRLKHDDHTKGRPTSKFHAQ